MAVGHVGRVVVTAVRTTARADVAALLDTIAPGRVWQYVPGDVAHLPAVVVLAPDVDPGDIPTTFDVTVEVLVVGRRIDHDDAQAELDALADTVDATIIPSPRFTWSNSRSVVATIAGVDYPAHRITVTATRVADC